MTLTESSKYHLMSMSHAYYNKSDQMRYSAPQAARDVWISSKYTYKNQPQFLQITFRSPQKITGIATKGSAMHSCWVKRYKLKYWSLDKKFGNFHGLMSGHHFIPDEVCSVVRRCATGSILNFQLDNEFAAGALVEHVLAVLSLC